MSLLLLDYVIAHKHILAVVTLQTFYLVGKLDLLTEPDIAHIVKEILGAWVFYVFAFLHLAHWISVRSNREIKEKTSLWSAKSLRILPSWIYAPKNLTGVKILGADISSVTSPEFFT